MLIDATHPEETRVAVISGHKLEEYDFESVARKQLKSNIYLVKVSRVEPSLQAAFVDFGGNRHGFLPFPEIHHDYYRIPIADREALLAEERALSAAEAAREDAEDEAALAAAEGGSSGENHEDDNVEQVAEEDDFQPETVEAGDGSEEPEESSYVAAEAEQEVIVGAETIDETEEGAEEEGDALPETEEASGDDAVEEEADVEMIGGDVVDVPVYRSSIKRRYKIQEVIKRNQIMLIQINKEERGNKGAAVTTYISLPGRYCVLMPNSPRGGGVSRKVANAKDRQRLKKILHELNVPDGMSVILRTAGVARSQEEIKRDLDYLLRLWDQIREFTLKSSAPALIYEEGNLIKRAIRDLYKRDIDEVHVAGEEAYNNAREFMRMLMPSHVENVHLYNDETMPLFHRYKVESQIDEIHNPTVHLKSGGYIVINPTEAMVSIDVNSGRATKGRHIEETALKTNIEAAEEIARQLRLRDQGGLIVIDFIDMEDNRNNRIVERKLRDAMQHDRARIQLGRISAFGLLELSRQRLHPSLVETNFEVCKHCSGSGLVRTVETTGVIVLRAIEEEGLRGRAAEIKVSVPTEVALYIFNNKREMLASIEKRHNIRVTLHADDSLMKPNYNIEISRAVGAAQAERLAQRPAPVKSVAISDMPEISEEETGDDEEQPREFSSVEEVGGRRHERRGRDGNREVNDESKDGGDRQRRRGRRGGRNRGRNRGGKGRPDGNRSQGGGQQDQGPSEPSSSDRAENAQNSQNSRQSSGGDQSSFNQPANQHGHEEGGSQENRKGWWKRLTE
jgi:ribonuclease E